MEEPDEGFQVAEGEPAGVVVRPGRADPEVGTRMPVSILTVVDLPAPFGPINPTISPLPTAVLNPSTARTSVPPRSTNPRNAPSAPRRCRATTNVLVRWWVSIISSSVESQES